MAALLIGKARIGGKVGKRELRFVGERTVLADKDMGLGGKERGEGQIVFL